MRTSQRQQRAGRARGHHGYTSTKQDRNDRDLHGIHLTFRQKAAEEICTPEQPDVPADFLSQRSDNRSRIFCHHCDIRMVLGA